jgi:hypothetical protein
MRHNEQWEIPSPRGHITSIFYRFACFPLQHYCSN